MFHMPIRGNLAPSCSVDVVGALAFAGIGLLVACRATTTEAVSGLMNLVMLPMWLFSGVFFSSERFPDAAQPFIQALPLTQLVGALRLVLLEGAGLFRTTSSRPWPSSPPGRSSPSPWPCASSAGPDARAAEPRNSRSLRSVARSAHQPRAMVQPPQRRDVDLVDQVAEEGRLGKDLEVQEATSRLRAGSPPASRPVQLAGRMDVAQRDGEDQPPGQAAPATAGALSAPTGRPPADDVVAVVDRLPAAAPDGLGPGLLGRRDQHEGQDRRRPGR